LPGHTAPAGRLLPIAYFFRRDAPVPHNMLAFRSSPLPASCGRLQVESRGSRHLPYRSPYLSFMHNRADRQTETGDAARPKAKTGDAGPRMGAAQLQLGDCCISHISFAAMRRCRTIRSPSGQTRCLQAAVGREPWLPTSSRSGPVLIRNARYARPKAKPGDAGRPKAKPGDAGPRMGAAQLQLGDCCYSQAGCRSGAVAPDILPIPIPNAR